MSAYTAHTTSKSTLLLTAQKSKQDVCLLKAYSPANRSGSPQGFHKTCTLHKHKTCKYNPNVSPFGIALIKNVIKLGDAGTMHSPFRSVVSIPD